MDLNIRFLCPICGCPGRWRPQRSSQWSCPACDHILAPEVKEQDGSLHCAICEHQELYKKKDFPHWLGLTVLASAFAVFLLAEAYYWNSLAWAVLIGSAVIDGTMYLTVGDVGVCYRCGTQHRGMSEIAKLSPFDLATAERYRQERIRRHAGQ
jgi:hypothetical protein